jgi:hypothetical protein
MTIAMILLAVLGPAVLTIAWWGLYEYVIPRRSFFADLAPKVQRRHLERFGAWEARHIAAMRGFHDAQHAIIGCRDASWRQLSARGWEVSLPSNHPLSLQLLAAKHPDGPTYDELAGIAPSMPTTIRTVALS